MTAALAMPIPACVVATIAAFLLGTAVGACLCAAGVVWTLRWAIRRERPQREAVR